MYTAKTNFRTKSTGVLRVIRKVYCEVGMILPERRSVGARLYDVKRPIKQGLTMSPAAVIDWLGLELSVR